jgi:hypothetical protein
MLDSYRNNIFVMQVNDYGNDPHRATEIPRRRWRLLLDAFYVPKLSLRPFFGDGHRDKFENGVARAYFEK